MEGEKNQYQGVTGEQDKEVEKNQYQGVTGEQDKEVKSRGLFDFMKKNEEKTEKEEKKEEELLVSDMENVHVTQLEKMEMDKKDQEKKEGLSAKLHRSDSSSSSSSDEEEVGPDGEKKKKKKGLKEKIHEKIGGEKKEENKPSKEAHVASGQAHVFSPPAPPPGHLDDTSIKVEKVDDAVKLEEVSPHGEEKKGFLEKIKDKLPGQKKPTEEVHVTPPIPIGSEEVNSPDDKEKKGIFGKIMEKIKGPEHKDGEKIKGPEHKDGEKTGESH
ncbi:Dehydrin COR410 [Carex littledalei]|uniref:Dehydrin COR410 n=1 Tax=Carex littledalei TaxID=544730 RepID=A0A833VXW0_9POAL|nr:Dehydrin COR410 [Carex littledalei]